MVSRSNRLAIRITAALMLSAILMLTLINLGKDWLNEQGIFLNFIVFYILVDAALYLPVLLVVHDTEKTLRIVIGLSMAHAAFDTWLPPYALDISGNILQSTALGYTGSIDYLFAVIGQGIHIYGFPLYVFTYVLMPATMFLGALMFLGATRYLKELT